MSITYFEDNIQEFGVSHNWYDTVVKDSIITGRGTKVEIIDRPKWGLACYMDNSIQSCEVDEKIYHEALVHPIMSCVKYKNRVMIIGGGEGATAREVLKWSGVEQVDMYEWDKDVVSLFRDKYPQWAKGAWDDKRLQLHYQDIFEIINNPPSSSVKKYDVVIIDLFEPCEENKKKWYTLLKAIPNWITLNGSIVMYAGMRNILQKQQPYLNLIRMIEYREYLSGVEIRDLSLLKEIIPYKVFIPSFSGESMFLLLKHSEPNKDFNFNEAHSLNSHITEDVWISYKTINW
jgi:spermidine synthase